MDAWMIIARALNLLDYPHWILTRDDITRAYIAKQHEMNIAYPVANTLKHVHAAPTTGPVDTNTSTGWTLVDRPEAPTRPMSAERGAMGGGLACHFVQGTSRHDNCPQTEKYQYERRHWTPCGCLAPLAGTAEITEHRCAGRRVARSEGSVEGCVVYVFG